jgi:type III pantothenate kinase
MAAALPHVDIAKPKEVIGRNTVSCMQSGVFWGYIGLVKEICKKIKEEKKEAMRRVATGGLAPLLQSTEALFEDVEENLTMHGLRLIFDHNKNIDSL